MIQENRAKKSRSVQIDLAPRLCKGCGICVAICPARVFTSEEGTGKAIVSAPRLCTDCSLCELLCPDYAISLEREATR